jgi:hypothetical protein
MNSETHPTEHGTDAAGTMLAIASGVPAPVAQGAFKALSRLIGGLADYPAAWLRRASQGVEDGTNARTVVSSAIALAAASQAVADPALVDRALTSYASGALRKQTNKERVAHHTLEALQATDAETPDTAATETQNVPAPDDDWMNVFERYAEDASSDRMQLLWGRVLAGEIRRPRSFALSTMRFLAEADQDLVQLAQRISQFVVGGMIIKTPEMDSGPILSDLLSAQDAGLVSAVGVAGIGWAPAWGPQGFLSLVGVQYALRIEAPPGWSTRIPIINVSKVGVQISKLSPPADEQQLLLQAAEHFKKAPVSAIHLGRLLSPVRMEYPSLIWEPAAPESL